MSSPPTTPGLTRASHAFGWLADRRIPAPLRGLAYRAWALVGKGYLIAPLRWPVIRWFADKAYLWFARNRYKVSGWFTGQERCDSCGPDACGINSAEAPGSEDCAEDKIRQ